MTNVTLPTSVENTVSGIGLEHPYYLLIFLPVFLFMLAYLRAGGMNGKKLRFLVVRSVIAALVVVALASPTYFISHKTVADVPPVTVLVDYSASMNMYPAASSLGYQIADRLRGAVGNLSGKSDNVKIEFFSEGNNTAIGDSLYHTEMQYGGQPMSIVLVSDGQNNRGRSPLDMARVLSQANSTIYTVKPQKKMDDVYIQAVLGDKKIPSSSQYDMLVRVGKTSINAVSFNLLVYIDNSMKFTKRMTQTDQMMDIPLSFSMRDIGVHEVRVEIEPPNDGFPENNLFYKTVEVVEKPKILLVSGNSTSPMKQVLERLYAVDATQNVDADYSRYSTVIFDNINSAELDRNRVNKIKKYILDGSGVAFVGGKNSFEYGGYNNSFVENILPVKSTDKPADRRRQFAVVFLIDVSQSTEYGSGKDSKIDVEKAVTIGIMRALNSNDTVGLVAFNNMPFIISTMSPYGPKSAEMEDNVLRLKFGGGTDMQYAIETADGMLKDYSTNKYLIIVSDGVLSQISRSQLAINKIAQMKDQGVKTYAVGVGFDTDERFMQAMAQAGGGQYFSLKSAPENRLKMVFGDEADDKTKDTTPVVRADDYHFITRNLVELDKAGASVRGFNKVYEKNVAQMLLSTKGGKPIMTVWRFGLGRVAALTSDNGLDWGQDLVKVDSGKVISGMTNWVIGDLEKGKKVRINSLDSYLGESAAFSITASSTPTVDVKHTKNMGSPQILLSRTGVSTYGSSFMPAEGGFYGIRAQAGGEQDLDAAAINYPREYASLDVDDDLLRRVAQVAGAREYSFDEVDTLVADIMAKVKTASTKDEANKISLWQYFAAAALAIYFLDAVVRRIMVILQREPKQKETSLR